VPLGALALPQGLSGRVTATILVFVVSLLWGASATWQGAMSEAEYLWFGRGFILAVSGAFVVSGGVGIGLPWYAWWVLVLLVGSAVSLLISWARGRLLTWPELDLTVAGSAMVGVGLALPERVVLAVAAGTWVLIGSACLRGWVLRGEPGRRPVVPALRRSAGPVLAAALSLVLASSSSAWLPSGPAARSQWVLAGAMAGYAIFAGAFLGIRLHPKDRAALGAGLAAAPALIGLGAALVRENAAFMAPSVAVTTLLALGYVLAELSGRLQE
jgi:hypothetical protein